MPFGNFYVCHSLVIVEYICSCPVYPLAGQGWFVKNTNFIIQIVSERESLIHLFTELVVIKFT